MKQRDTKRQNHATLPAFSAPAARLPHVRHHTRTRTRLSIPPLARAPNPRTRTEPQRRAVVEFLQRMGIEEVLSFSSFVSPFEGLWHGSGVGVVCKRLPECCVDFECFACFMLFLFLPCFGEAHVHVWIP